MLLPRASVLVGVVEDVAVVVAGVGRAAVDVVVAAGEEDVAALRQHELRAAEDIGAGAIRQRQMAAARGPGARIPDVVDEEAGLHAVAVGAVGQDAPVGREHRVGRDQRPGKRRRPGAAHIVCLSGRRNGKSGDRRCQTDTIRHGETPNLFIFCRRPLLRGSF